MALPKTTAWLIAAAMAIPLQASAVGRPALESAALFAQACLPTTGRPEALRSWAAAHRLPQVDRLAAIAMARGRPAMAYGASTVDGKLALLSLDDGTCQVIMPAGDLAEVGDAMTLILKRSGIEATLSTMRDDDAKGAHQLAFAAKGRGKAWDLSITSHAHQDAPSVQPEVTLTATEPSKTR